MLGAVMLATAAFGQERHALVVGINAYSELPVLSKAINDAEAVAAAFTELGFSVTALMDPGLQDWAIALAEFASGIEEGDEVAFFFAGHGTQVQGRNYLLPADIPLLRAGQETVLGLQAIAADSIIDMFQDAGARVSLIILDACRDNPFPPAGGARSSSGGVSGLAHMSASEGVFILFSAGTFQVAREYLDEADEHPNSIFTRALLPRLTEQGLALHEMARLVRADVQRLSASAGFDQRPAYYDEIVGDFALFPLPDRDIAIDEAFPLPPPPAPPSIGENFGAQSEPDETALAETEMDRCTEAQAVWRYVLQEPTISGIEQFLNHFSDCEGYASLGALWLEVLASVETPPGATNVAPEDLPPEEADAVATILEQVTETIDPTLRPIIRPELQDERDPQNEPEPMAEAAAPTLSLVAVRRHADGATALVRMPSGRLAQVRAGDLLDDGRVDAISETGLRYLQAGQARTLELVSAQPSSQDALSFDTELAGLIISAAERGLAWRQRDLQHLSASTLSELGRLLDLPPDTADIEAIVTMLTEMMPPAPSPDTTGPLVVRTTAFDDESVYEGQYRGTVRHGIGTYRMPSGYEYHGAWVDDEIEGLGRAVFPDGSVYEGEFLAGQPHGVGLVIFADGGIHYGEWRNGEITGTGIATYANGVVYLGEFVAASQSGIGLMRAPNGYTYEGTWRDSEKHGRGEIHYPDGAIYQGDFAADARAGQGLLWMPDGLIYEGDWSEGQITGEGTLYNANGDVFEGTFVDGQRWGQGFVTYENGDTYRGGFVDDQRQGEGTFVGTDGYRYVGDWFEGRIEGEGQVTYPDGAVYGGSFRNDLAHGQGEITYADGSRYIGDWVDGVIEGVGVAHYANGLVYEGEFADSQQEGQGVLIMRTEDGAESYRYDGSWLAGQRHGDAMVTYPDGAVYEGQFENGVRSGQGMLVMPSGYSYSGEWAAGEINGEGIARYASGDVYRGSFETGTRAGFGLLCWADGNSSQGTWVAGELVGTGVSNPTACEKLLAD